MKPQPSKAVLEAFNLPNQLLSLQGGRGNCWRSRDVILKPSENILEWRWVQEVFSGLVQDGFRVAVPLFSGDGELFVHGWCAQIALAGAHPVGGNWEGVLSAGDVFHSAIAHIPRPDFLGDNDDPWAIGDRVAWGEIEAPDKHPVLSGLLELCEPIDLPEQLIHGDLTENVLFAHGLAPAIIDFCPYYRPVGFSSAVVVADAVCWREADPDELLGYVSKIDEFPQLLLRAIIYRIVTTLAFKNKENLDGYKPGIEMVQRLIK
ncbi:MAG: TIGR02569 family protein [Thermoplasmata archaeon]|nr:TIGR02569 family protein [Thermoplasmata archaeon]